MRSEVRRLVEMFRRVRQFLTAHQSLDPGFAEMVTRIEDRLTRVEAIEARETAGRGDSRSASAHRRELRRVLHFQLIRYLVAVGSVAAKDRAELIGRFKLPSGNATNAAFLSTVKGLLALAETQRELLVTIGMKDDLLANLTRMAGEFEAAAESVRAARLTHIGARADLEALTTDLLGVVKVVDGMIRYGFGDNPEIMAEWLAAKAVPAARVSSKRAGEGPVPGTGPTPGGIAPAA